MIAILAAKPVASAAPPTPPPAPATACASTLPAEPRTFVLALGAECATLAGIDFAGHAVPFSARRDT